MRLPRNSAASYPTDAKSIIFETQVDLIQSTKS
jgi:hypothetical protein